MRELLSSKTGAAAVLIALALSFFTLGRISGPLPAVNAQGDAGEMSVYNAGPTSALVFYYPAQRRVYVYQTPFTGINRQGCTYSFQLGDPGEPIKRENCKAINLN